MTLLWQWNGSLSVLCPSVTTWIISSSLSLAPLREAWDTWQGGISNVFLLLSDYIRTNSVCLLICICLIGFRDNLHDFRAHCSRCMLKACGQESSAKWCHVWLHVFVVPRLGLKCSLELRRCLNMCINLMFAHICIACLRVWCCIWICACACVDFKLLGV